MHEPSGDFHQVGLPSRASLRIPSRNRLTDRDSSHGLCFPTAHAESKVLVRKACQPIAGAPAGFGYPLDASSFDALPVLFRTGSTHGIHPSKLSPRERHPAVSRPKDPRTVSLRLKNPPEGGVCELAAAVSGFCSFRESLAIKPVFSGPIAGCSLGFCSSRVVGQKPCRDFAQAPLACLVRGRTRAPAP